MNNLARQAGNHEVVSFDTEELILVNADDSEIGYLHKDKCHDGEGHLHRAFSLFIFNDAGEVLIQQRSDSKRLWPGFWANSCCSHPRRGEPMEDAVSRRLYQELGMRGELEFLYKFIYHAQFQDAGSEHELCWVYVGHSGDKVQANPNEIADWRYLAPDELTAELEQHPEQFSPWIKLEWEVLRRDHASAMQRMRCRPHD